MAHIYPGLNTNNQPIQYDTTQHQHPTIILAPTPQQQAQLACQLAASYTQTQKHVIYLTQEQYVPYFKQQGCDTPAYRTWEYTDAAETTAYNMTIRTMELDPANTPFLIIYHDINNILNECNDPQKFIHDTQQTIQGNLGHDWCHIIITAQNLQEIPPQLTHNTTTLIHHGPITPETIPTLKPWSTALKNTTEITDTTYFEKQNGIVTATPII